MNYFIILIICISLDAFIIMMEKGAVMPSFHIGKSLIHSLIFGAIDALMFVGGNFLASLFFTEKMARINRLVACIALVFISIKIIHQTSSKKPFEERLDPSFDYHASVRLALLSGIDCFLVGLGLYYLHIPFQIQGLTVFIVTFLIVYMALLTGYYQGLLAQKGVYYLSAIVYLIVAFMQLGIMF